MARHFSGRRLRESRKAAGISIELLALAITRSAYSVLEYERGRVTPPVTVIAAMADVLGRPIDDLLSEEEAHAA
ncbi:helix-turn-helix domain-containing protein [Streptomyces sp. NPDC090112]|uniref:helix-turn-helix domain-containing protein n=1 Tax=Streptomyces sp. NPDC090112 TaxID=3365949 RepID=UPI00380AFA87